MSIRSSARNESADTELGEERERRYGGGFVKITGAPTHLISEERENSSTIRSGSSDKKLSVEERKRFGEEM